MADRLASPADLASLLQQDVDTATATLLIECATAVVQAAAGQRIVRVVDDEVTLDGTDELYLWLPQLPVVSVSAVKVDDVALTTDGWRLRGHRLWRSTGWLPVCAPSTVTVTYTHGYADDAQELQLARGAVLGLAATPYENPGGSNSVKIDDYAAAYEAMSNRMDASPYLQKALLRQYGRPAGLVRIG